VVLIAIDSLSSQWVSRGWWEHLQESVNDGDCEVESFLQQVESLMDLDEPVHEDQSHSWRDCVT